MHSTITISALGLVGIIVLAFAIGWLFGRVRLHTSVKFSFSKADPDESLRPSFSATKQTLSVTNESRALSLKCQCGATWRFHETSGHADQGSQPMPEGDSYTCPNCGRTIDLGEMRRLLGEQTRSLPGLK